MQQDVFLAREVTNEISKENKNNSRYHTAHAFRAVLKYCRGIGKFEGASLRTLECFLLNRSPLKELTSMQCNVVCPPASETKRKEGRNDIPQLRV